jgi:hypothetical protein
MEFAKTYDKIDIDGEDSYTPKYDPIDTRRYEDMWEWPLMDLVKRLNFPNSFKELRDEIKVDLEKNWPYLKKLVLVRTLMKKLKTLESWNLIFAFHEKMEDVIQKFMDSQERILEVLIEILESRYLDDWEDLKNIYNLKERGDDTIQQDLVEGAIRFWKDEQDEMFNWYSYSSDGTVDTSFIDEDEDKILFSKMGLPYKESKEDQLSISLLKKPHSSQCSLLKKPHLQPQTSQKRSHWLQISSRSLSRKLRRKKFQDTCQTAHPNVFAIPQN